MAKSPSSMVQSPLFLVKSPCFMVIFSSHEYPMVSITIFRCFVSAISQESSEERWLEERQAREAQGQGLEDPEISC